MRIKSVRIDSFGKLRDREIALGPKLNVFYGLNESGKTSTMEFIRKTFVAPKGNKHYPEPAKTDSGRIVYTEDGETKEIRLKYKDRKGDIPRCLEGMDQGLYRSVFAMNQSDLDDEGAVTGDEIRSKFLTIPGGENMPDVIQQIDDDSDSLIGKRSNSPSRLNDLNRSIKSTEEEIALLRRDAEQYTDITGQISELESRLATLKGSNSGVEENNALYRKVETIRPTYDKYTQARMDLEGLKEKIIPDDSESERYLVLKSNVRGFSEDLDQLRPLVDSLESRLSECGEEAVRCNKDSISDLLARRAEYEFRRSSLVQVTKGEQKPLLLAALPLVVMIPILLINLDIIVKAAICAALVAAAIALFVFTRKDEALKVNTDEEWVARYEQSVTSMATRLNLTGTSVTSNLARMSDMLETLSQLDAVKPGFVRTKVGLHASKNALLIMLSDYGGEEGFIEAQKRSERITELQNKVRTLEDAIMASGFDPEQPLPEVQLIPVDNGEQMELSKQIGTLNERKTAILDTSKLDAEIDKLYSLRTERERVLRKGAVAMLESHIVEEACTELYGNVHPAVLSTADRYLDMMTSGTCRFDADPRNKDLTVISNGEVKNSKKWSSGLRAQILLSLKLAVAKEMGSGEIPVILDDVLLPFDSIRKEGAFRALSQLSEDMQVLLFTCDDDILELAEKGDCNLVQM